MCTRARTHVAHMHVRMAHTHGTPAGLKVLELNELCCTLWTTETKQKKKVMRVPLDASATAEHVVAWLHSFAPRFGDAAERCEAAQLDGAQLLAMVSPEQLGLFGTHPRARTDARTCACTHVSKQAGLSRVERAELWLQIQRARAKGTHVCMHSGAGAHTHEQHGMPGSHDEEVGVPCRPSSIELADRRTTNHINLG